MNWSSYISRRRLDVESWLTSRKITDGETFVDHLRSIGVDPPDSAEILRMFPKPPPAVKETDENPAAPKGESQPTARSMVGQGDSVGVRTGRRSDSKLRG